MGARRAQAALFGLLLALHGCGGEPVRSPAEKSPKAEAIPERDARSPRPALGAPDPAGSNPADYWYDRFHDYMSADVRARYLGTKKDERFHAFAGLLLDYERREALLEPVRARLGRDDLARYHALKDLDACARFLSTRFPDAAPAPKGSP